MTSARRVDDVEMAVWRCRAEVDHHDALRQTGDSGTSLHMSTATQVFARPKPRRGLQVGYIALRTGLQDWDLALMPWGVA